MLALADRPRRGPVRAAPLPHQYIIPLGRTARRNCWDVRRRQQEGAGGVPQNCLRPVGRNWKSCATCRPRQLGRAWPPRASVKPSRRLRAGRVFRRGGLRRRVRSGGQCSRRPLVRLTPGLLDAKPNRRTSRAMVYAFGRTLTLGGPPRSERWPAQRHRGSSLKHCTTLLPTGSAVAAIWHRSYGAVSIRRTAMATAGYAIPQRAWGVGSGMGGRVLKHCTTLLPTGSAVAAIWHRSLRRSSIRRTAMAHCRIRPYRHRPLPSSPSVSPLCRRPQPQRDVATIVLPAGLEMLPRAPPFSLATSPLHLGERQTIARQARSAFCSPWIPPHAAPQSVQKTPVIPTPGAPVHRSPNEPISSSPPLQGLLHLPPVRTPVGVRSSCFARCHRSSQVQPFGFGLHTPAYAR